MDIVSDYAVVAQLAERVHGKDEVSGSIPDIGSKQTNTTAYYFFKLAIQACIASLTTGSTLYA